MNEIQQLRTQQINNFMAQFDNLNDVTVDVISEGLKTILGGETPGIDFEYGVDYMLNEDTGDEEKLEGLKKIHILYTYDNGTNVPGIGKLSYIVG